MNECSQTDQIGYKVCIKNDFSNNMIFSLTSRYKSLTRGDPVQFGDEVRVIHNRSGNNLSISLLNFEIDDFSAEEHSNPYVVKKLLFDPLSSRHKVFLGGNYLNTWRVFPQSRRNN